MHPEDRIQKFKKNGEPISDGGITFKEMGNHENHDFLVGGSMVIVYRRTENGLELLFQQRAASMLTDPNKWDIHGGFINYGETPLEAMVREAEEEVGLKLDPEKLRFCFRIRQHINEFCNFYLYDLTNENQEIHFNDKEVQAVKWVDFETFKYHREEIDIKENLQKNEDFITLSIRFLERYGNLDK